MLFVDRLIAKNATASAMNAKPGRAWYLRYLPSLLDSLGFLLIMFTAVIVLSSLTLAIQSLTFWLTDLEEADTFVDTMSGRGGCPLGGGVSLSTVTTLMEPYRNTHRNSLVTLGCYR